MEFHPLNGELVARVIRAATFVREERKRAEKIKETRVLHLSSFRNELIILRRV